MANPDSAFRLEKIANKKIAMGMMALNLLVIL
jgi:hypothetical protein